MRLIIGGYSQGKTEYVMQNYDNAGEHIFILNDWAREIFDKKRDPIPELRKKTEKDPDIIIITDEIGNGIVPADRQEREFREWIGRLQIKLAEQADEVIRVMCGIGQKIK